MNQEILLQKNIYTHDLGNITFFMNSEILMQKKKYIHMMAMLPSL